MKISMLIIIKITYFVLSVFLIRNQVVYDVFRRIIHLTAKWYAHIKLMHSTQAPERFFRTAIYKIIKSSGLQIQYHKALVIKTLLQSRNNVHREAYRQFTSNAHMWARFLEVMWIVCFIAVSTELFEILDEEYGKKPMVDNAKITSNIAPELNGDGLNDEQNEKTNADDEFTEEELENFRNFLGGVKFFVTAIAFILSKFS